MSAMASQITSLTILYSIITSLTILYPTVYSGADQRKHQSAASLAFVRRIHRWPVNSPRKGPVTRKSFHLMTSSWFDTFHDLSFSGYGKCRWKWRKHAHRWFNFGDFPLSIKRSLIARFMGPTWGLPGAAGTQVGPVLATWTLLSGVRYHQMLWTELSQPWRRVVRH